MLRLYTVDAAQPQSIVSHTPGEIWGRTCRNLQNPEDLTSNAMLERQTTTICDCSFRGGPLFPIEKRVGTVSESSSIIRHGVAVYEEFGDSLGTAI
jgi:hypothetical protein